MPVVTMSHSGGSSNFSGRRQGPNSHIVLAVFGLLFNPIFGIVAVGFAIASRMAAPVDWDGARMKGKISMFISITGIVISAIGVLAFILIFYTKDS